ncbi:hypothetical protein FHX37_4276 [Haloactinospora alba]|uniref:Uncharacterized protein n=1 Tax=Haloactinospora alba TaxID=405555 RepID=A0A543N6U1_9ACTN|nr:hypothetical protein FHX37_4276 [Haloactinospora alba]
MCVRAVVLGTNVISEVFRRQPGVRVPEWLESLTGEVAITTVTLAELPAGVRRLMRQPEHQGLLQCRHRADRPLGRLAVGSRARDAAEPGTGTGSTDGQESAVLGPAP